MSATAPSFTLSKRAQSLSIWALYVVGLVPAAWYFWLGATGKLPGDPVKIFERFLGLWALRFLIAGLFVTPLRDLTRFNLLRYRRALGLLAFYYVAMHFAVYLILDQSLMLSAVVDDVLKRPFIMLGMAGLVLLIPLALTSSNAAIRKLGSRWGQLHKLVYAVAAAGALHYALSVKVLTAEQYIYLALVILLLAYRLIRPKILEAKKARRKLQASAAR